MMAEAISRIVGTRAQAAEALEAVVSTGKVPAAALEQVAQAAINLQRVAGVPLQETIKEFAALGDKPSQAAEQLNKKYNFLTAAIYDQIRALEHQGKTAEAAQTAQDALLKSVNECTKELTDRLGFLPKAWAAIGDAAKFAWDSMLGIGRQETPDEELKRLLDRQGFLSREIGAGRLVGAGTVSQENNAITARIADLRKQIAAADAKAAGQAQQQQNLEKNLSDRALDQVRQAAAGQMAAAQLQASLGGIQRTLTASETAFAAYEETLDAQRSAGLLSEQEYFKARADLIEGDRAAHTAALRDELRLFDVEAARLQKQRAAIGRDTNLSPAETGKAQGALDVQALQLQQRRKDLAEQLALVNAKASADGQRNSAAALAALNAEASGYLTARQAAEQYLDTLQRRQQIELASFGLGDRERQRLTGRADIGDNYAQQRRDLDNQRVQAELEGRFNADAQTRYKKQLDLLNEFQGKALQSYDDYWKALTERQGSFYLGAQEALRNYIDQSRDTAGQVASALSRGFDSATDALVKFVQTGKLDFKSLVDSIIADLLRIQLQKSIATVLSGALSSLGGLFGGVTSGAASGGGGLAGARAGGGPIDAGRAYLVGERGPEVIVPRIPATVIPNRALGAMGGDTHFHISSPLTVGAGVNAAEVDAVLSRRNAEIRAQIIQDITRGRLNGALRMSGAF